jgi:predicted nucleotide-binding protein (sugar kinase/HSP70/actin superfamily)
VKILKAGIFVANHTNLFPIRMMNFACGPDSLKIYQEEKIQQSAGKPMLSLLTDAQTNNAPFVTRTEAYERVVSQTRTRKVRIKQMRIYPKDGNKNRIWLIPYMGDTSYVGAAGIRHFGIRSQVLPTNTARGYEVARKYIHTEVCQPLKGVVGDTLSFLHEQIDVQGKENVERDYLLMLPSTSGPCRYGKYTEVVRDFMDREGLQNIPVVGPTTEADYSDIPLPGRSAARELRKILFKGIKASGLLEDITLRFRPYARDKLAVEQLRTQRLHELENIIEDGAEVEDIVRWGEDTVTQYKQNIPIGRERFPLVLYIGEIYMRQHDPYTQNVVEKLEAQKLELMRDPVTEWLNYVNQINQRDLKKEIELAVRGFNLSRAMNDAKKLRELFIKGRYMSFVEERISEPFKDVLDGRHILPRPIDIICTLERHYEYDGDISGESPLSIGITYYFMHDLAKSRNGVYISGIFHVGPFTCMQEGVATAKIEAMAKELRRKKPDLVLPIIHAFFGDSSSVNLDSEIAVFTEQCYQKCDMLKAKYAAAVRPIVELRPVSSKKKASQQLTAVDRTE